MRAAPDEPTSEDLDRIEREWPLIEAEMALVKAEIRILTATGGPTALDWRRLRRAEQRVLRHAALALVGASTEPAGAELGEVA